MTQILSSRFVYLIILTVAIVGTSWLPASLSAATYTKSPLVSYQPDRLNIAAGSYLRIENSLGNTQVSFTNGSEIELSATYQSNGSAAQTDEILVERMANQYTLMVRPKDKNIDIKLSVPQTINLRVFSEAGNIEIIGASTSLLVQTDRGNIQLNLPQKIDADLSLSTAIGLIRSARWLKSIGTSDPHFLHGQLGNGGALVMAHSERGQIILDTADKESPYLANNSQPTINILPTPNPIVAINTPANTTDSNIGASSSLTTSTPTNSTNAPSIRSAETLLPLPNPIIAPPTSSDNNDDGGSDAEIVKIDSQLVTINVSASTGRGEPLIDLKKSDFKVLEDGVPQEIAHFQSIRTPFNLVLLIDLSVSVKDKIDLIRRAAKRFVEATRPEDKVAIITFTDKIQLISALTSNHELLFKRIDSIKRASGGTNFYDALESTVKYLIGPVRTQRNAIVVLTDGVDNALPHVPGEGSYITFDKVFEHIQETNTTIFPIYLDTEDEALEEFGLTISEAYLIARKQLQDLAETTGGTIYFAKRAEDLEAQYNKVAARLGLIYSLGYYPTNAKNDATFRKIDVAVPYRSDVQIRTRKGYYANKP